MQYMFEDKMTNVAWEIDDGRRHYCCRFVMMRITKSPDVDLALRFQTFLLARPVVLLVYVREVLSEVVLGGEIG